MQTYRLKIAFFTISITLLLLIATKIIHSAHFDESEEDIPDPPVVQHVLESPTSTSPVDNPTIIYYDDYYLDKGWPVREAARNWNKNGNVLFRKGFNDRGEALILFMEAPLIDLWGITQLHGESLKLAVIALDKNVPKGEARLHNLCHELGHVLGLTHNDGGCMDVTQINPYPSESSLKEVGNRDWSWEQVQDASLEN